MATLRYGSELLSGVPDNTAQLIRPVNIQDIIASTIIGRGFISSNTEVLLSLTQGQALILNAVLQNVSAVDGLWTVDGNNRLNPKHADRLPDTTVPAGFQKPVTLFAAMSFDKLDTPGSDYELSFFGPVGLVGQPFTMVFDQRDAESMVMTVNAVVDISLSGGYGITITPLDSSSDLTLLSIEMSVMDTNLANDRGGP